MICYNESQLILYVTAIVIISIIAYCYFIKPEINYGQYYFDNRKTDNNNGLTIGGHLSSHSGAISASPYIK
jgi:capsule polysaccharide export protein KpsE/RkpR